MASTRKIIELATRVQQVSSSMTLAITAKAKAMKAEGFDVCSFSAGEPDFDTPNHIKEAAKQALDEGKTKYGAAAGEIKLREALVNKLKRENQLEYTTNNLIVTNGGKHSLYNLMQALIESGDEVIIPAPYWVSYPEMVKLADGKPVIVATEAANGYKITPEQLSQAVTPQTKLFILNSPSNPTGSVYTPEEIRGLAQVVVEKDILVVSDEIYEHILYGDSQHLSIGAASPEAFSRTIVSNGFAKSYAMTGWRIGYIAAPVEIIKAMTKIQSHSTSNVCTFAQYGAIAAIEGTQEPVKVMLSAFTERRSAMMAGIEAIPGLSCTQPDGAFYLFVDISKTGKGSLEFCQSLLESLHVATIPGIAFGNDNCIRLSYATDMTSIEKGLERIGKFVNNIK